MRRIQHLFLALPFVLIGALVSVPLFVASIFKAGKFSANHSVAYADTPFIEGTSQGEAGCSEGTGEGSGEGSGEGCCGEGGGGEGGGEGA